MSVVGYPTRVISHGTRSTICWLRSQWVRIRVLMVVPVVLPVIHDWFTWLQSDSPAFNSVRMSGRLVAFGSLRTFHLPIQPGLMAQLQYILGTNQTVCTKNRGIRANYLAPVEKSALPLLRLASARPSELAEQSWASLRM